MNRTCHQIPRCPLCLKQQYFLFGEKSFYALLNWLFTIGGFYVCLTDSHFEVRPVCPAHDPSVYIRLLHGVVVRSTAKHRDFFSSHRSCTVCEIVSLIEPTACPTVFGGRANEGKSIKLFSTLLSTFIKLQLHVLFGSAKILIFFVAVSIVCLR